MFMLRPMNDNLVADANDLDVPSQFQMIGGDTYLVPGSATAALVAVGGLIGISLVHIAYRHNT